MDFYETLGVPREASHKQIRQAYLQIARRLHPDRASGENEAAQEMLAAAGEAWSVLRDARLRRCYDAKGREGLDELSDNEGETPASNEGSTSEYDSDGMDAQPKSTPTPPLMSGISSLLPEHQPATAKVTSAGRAVKGGSELSASSALDAFFQPVMQAKAAASVGTSTSTGQRHGSREREAKAAIRARAEENVRSMEAAMRAAAEERAKVGVAAAKKEALQRERTIKEAAKTAVDLQALSSAVEKERAVADAVRAIPRP